MIWCNGRKIWRIVIECVKAALNWDMSLFCIKVLSVLHMLKFNLRSSDRDNMLRVSCDPHSATRSNDGWLFFVKILWIECFFENNNGALANRQLWSIYHWYERCIPLQTPVIKQCWAIIRYNATASQWIAHFSLIDMLYATIWDIMLLFELDE